MDPKRIARIALDPGEPVTACRLVDDERSSKGTSLIGNIKMPSQSVPVQDVSALFRVKVRYEVFLYKSSALNSVTNNSVKIRELETLRDVKISLYCTN